MLMHAAQTRAENIMKRNKRGLDRAVAHAPRSTWPAEAIRSYFRHILGSCVTELRAAVHLSLWRPTWYPLWAQIDRTGTVAAITLRNEHRFNLHAACRLSALARTKTERDSCG
jgi:hypothetical protein